MKQINNIKVGDFFTIAGETFIRLSYNRSNKQYVARKLNGGKLYEFARSIYVNNFTAKENEQIRVNL